jgi:hypothetical protein
MLRIRWLVSIIERLAFSSRRSMMLEGYSLGAAGRPAVRSREGRRLFCQRVILTSKGECCCPWNCANPIFGLQSILFSLLARTVYPRFEESFVELRNWWRNVGQFLKCSQSSWVSRIFKISSPWVPNVRIRDRTIMWELQKLNKLREHRIHPPIKGKVDLIDRAALI